MYLRGFDSFYTVVVTGDQVMPDMGT